MMLFKPATQLFIFSSAFAANSTENLQENPPYSIDSFYSGTYLPLQEFPICFHFLLMAWLHFFMYLQCHVGIVRIELETCLQIAHGINAFFICP